jgi:hypothetical protein
LIACHCPANSTDRLTIWLLELRTTSLFLADVSTSPTTIVLAAGRPTTTPYTLMTTVLCMLATRALATVLHLLAP